MGYQDEDGSYPDEDGAPHTAEDDADGYAGNDQDGALDAGAQADEDTGSTGKLLDLPGTTHEELALEYGTAPQDDEDTGLSG